MRRLSKKLKDYQIKDEPHQNVRVTEIKLSLDNVVMLVFKFMIASLIVGAALFGASQILFLITGFTVFSF